MTYTACFCRQATVLRVRLSRLDTILSFYLYLAGESQKYKPRAGETHAEGVTKTGGIPDFIWATAGTFGCLEIFEIFGHNHLDCVIK